MKRRNLSKMSEEDKKAHKAKQSKLRKKKWRQRQIAFKQERGLPLKPRIVQPWMLRLVKPGIEYLAALRNPCSNTIEEFRQYLAGQGKQGQRLISVLKKRKSIYKSVHLTIMLVSPPSYDLVGTRQG